MKWALIADIVKAAAAGLTAVIATVKFFMEITKDDHNEAPEDEMEETE